MLNKQDSNSSVSSTSPAASTDVSLTGEPDSGATATSPTSTNATGTAAGGDTTTSPSTPAPPTVDNETDLTFKVLVHYPKLNTMDRWEEMKLIIGRKSGPQSFKHLGITVRYVGH